VFCFTDSWNFCCAPSSRNGSAKSVSCSNSHLHFWPSPSHRIVPLSHRIRILHLHRIFRTFFAFLHFLLHVLQSVHQKVVKSAKTCEKNAKKVLKMRKYAKKCEMRMRRKNGIKIRISLHRTTTAKKKNRIFALFRIAFASHYNPCRVGLRLLTISAPTHKKHRAKTQNRLGTYSPFNVDRFEFDLMATETLYLRKAVTCRWTGWEGTGRVKLSSFNLLGFWKFHPIVCGYCKKCIEICLDLLCPNSQVPSGLLLT
jgi:hypothetical protein